MSHFPSFFISSTIQCTLGFRTKRFTAQPVGIQARKTMKCQKNGHLHRTTEDQEKKQLAELELKPKNMCP